MVAVNIIIAIVIVVIFIFHGIYKLDRIFLTIDADNYGVYAYIPYIRRLYLLRSKIIYINILLETVTI